MFIASSLFTVLVALLLPVGISIVLACRKEGYLRPILFGALTFFVFQVIIRIPLLQLVLPKMHWFAVLSAMPLASSLFLGTTAALFEEGGRGLVMRLFLKDRLQPRYGIAFGIGHGGIEAILFAGINALAMLFIAAPPVSAGMMFAGGVERLSAMIFHIGWSVMVLKSIRERKPVWLLLAFLLHAALDAAVVYAAYSGASVTAIEAALVVLAAGMLFYIIYEYKKYKEDIK